MDLLTRKPLLLYIARQWAEGYDRSSIPIPLAQWAEGYDRSSIPISLVHWAEGYDRIEFDS